MATLNAIYRISGDIRGLQDQMHRVAAATDALKESVQRADVAITRLHEHTREKARRVRQAAKRSSG